MTPQRFFSKDPDLDIQIIQEPTLRRLIRKACVLSSPQHLLNLTDVCLRYFQLTCHCASWMRSRLSFSLVWSILLLFFFSLSFLFLKGTWDSLRRMDLKVEVTVSRWRIDYLHNQVGRLMSSEIKGNECGSYC